MVRTPARLEAVVARNLITDVAGVRVGHAEDTKLGSGVTVVVFDKPAVAPGALRGGAGAGPATTGAGTTVGALAVANAAGSAVIGGGPHFWAAAFERDGEFGGRGQPAQVPPQALTFRTKGQPGENTTLVVV